MRERTVLIIDDEKRMADSLHDLLEGVGYHCQVAYGGRAGIDMLRRHAFDVMITDLRMQDLDGLEVIRYAQAHVPRMLIIVITGYASTESAIEALHLHVYDYLRKPFNFDHLYSLIEKAFQKLEADQLREDTTAMITHDIKIPLTSILGFASMIYDRERQEYHPRAREFAEAIQANGQKVLAMIENYLTTSKIEAGTLRIMPTVVDLRRLILDVVETAQIAATRRGRQIEVQIGQIPETVEADEPLMFRAVSNLVQNAIKYSSCSEQPILLRAERVNAAASPLEAPAICIETFNSAAIASPTELEDIFQRYKRIHPGAGIEGTGLGLYVVQAVVRAHGGDVAAELLDSGQVRFAIYLPE